MLLIILVTALYFENKFLLNEIFHRGEEKDDDPDVAQYYKENYFF